MQHNKIDVLDNGYVILQDVMGSDLSVVNSARASYGKKEEQLTPAGERLIAFLAREGHTSPFRHATMQFEVRAPLMIARQWWKYVVGSTWQDPLQAWNESSRRYITEKNEYHLPEYFRLAPENSKQGSGGPISAELNTKWLDILAHHQMRGEQIYQDMMKDGICAEQARLALPAYGLYVTFYWTASLQGVIHLINQRVDKEAQWEFQQFAQAVETFAKNHFPVSLEELRKHG